MPINHLFYINGFKDVCVLLLQVHLPHCFVCSVSEELGLSFAHLYQKERLSHDTCADLQNVSSTPNVHSHNTFIKKFTLSIVVDIFRSM